MAFSLDSVKRKARTKQTEVFDCHFYLKDLDILTENTRYALWKYVDYRFRKRHRGTLSSQQLEPLVQELLSYCCNKPYQSISRQDVINNENSIIYEIKRAIYFGATRCLYDKDNQVLQIDKSKFKDTLDEPERVSTDFNMTLDAVKDYFKDLI